MAQKFLVTIPSDKVQHAGWVVKALEQYWEDYFNISEVDVPYIKAEKVK